MHNVSEDFKTSVVATSRKTDLIISFEIIDVTAKPDSTPTTTSEAVISRKQQLKNDIRDISGKYATFEKDYWLLDGKQVISPRTNDGEFEVGFWSNNLSNTDKTFTSPPVITFDFAETHSSVGFTIFFDKLANEYAVDFNLKAYDTSNNIITDETILGNTKTKVIVNKNTLDYKKIEITILKWSRAFGRARVIEVDFGIIEEYKNDVLIDSSILNEFSIISENIPSDELTFSIENKDKRFDILNPIGIYKFLQRRQRLDAKIGVETTENNFEYVPMGVYYLTDWVSESGGLVANFTARDILDLMEQSVYKKSKFQVITIFDLVEDILIDSGVTDYYIDNALKSESVIGYIPNVSHKEALRMAAEAGRAVAYSDKNGKLNIKRLSYEDTNGIIDFDNSYKTPQITLEKLINTVNVFQYNFVVVGSEVLFEGSFSQSGFYWLDFSKPTNNASLSITGGTIISSFIYANSALVQISTSGAAVLKVTGNAIELSSNLVTLISPDKQESELNFSYDIKNTLINNAQIAEMLGEWALNYKINRNLYSVEWRQNPTFEIGDVVTIEDDFGLNYKTTIYHQDFKYKGYLMGNTKAKGGS